MSRGLNLTGQRFGRLVAIGPCGRSKDRHIMWLCRCDCGNEIVVTSKNLKQCTTKSCGCFNIERVRESRQTHGKSHIRLYRIWSAIKQRCLNPNREAYPNYAARGITVCNEWLHFEPFYEWSTANGYRDDLTIDRINNDKGYCPENCRWVSMKAQANNRRSNRRITYNSETHTLAEWSEITGISKTTIRDRLKSGWTVERALTTANKQQMERK